MGHHFLSVKYVNFDFKWLKMKNKEAAAHFVGFFFLLLLVGCDRMPQVYSVNYFRSGFENNGSIPGVKRMPVQEIIGVWEGLNHQIKVSSCSFSNFLRDTLNTKKGACMYFAELIDKDPDKAGFMDTTAYDLTFIYIAGQPFLEVISPGTKISAHDFMLPISTYLKINKLTPDTLIVQMPESVYTEGFLKAKGYAYFVPADYNKEDSYPLYITETPERLGLLLKELSAIPQAFQKADTLVKKH